MDSQLMEYTKIASYFLWEYTKYDDPLSHWHCSENIACCLERHRITQIEQVYSIKKREKVDLVYVEFVRKIAFMIYIYTNNDDELFNWFTAEKLLYNDEWCIAVVRMANAYEAEKESLDFISKFRSEQVREYYRGLL